MCEKDMEKIDEDDYEIDREGLESGSLSSVIPRVVINFKNAVSITEIKLINLSGVVRIIVVPIKSNGEQGVS